MPVSKVSQFICKGCPYWDTQDVEKRANMLANNNCNKRERGSCLK